MAITTVPRHSPRRSTAIKPGRVKFAYEPVTQKFIAHVKSKTKFKLYGDLPDILGFGAWSGDSTTSLTSSARSMFVRASSIVDLRRGFESLYVYSSIVEPRIVGDKIAPLLRIVPITGRHGEMVTTRFDHVQYIPVMSREFGSVDKRRHGPTSAIRTWEGDGDTSLSTVQLRAIQMNYDDYYARQVGGALPYFTGARVQRGHGFGSLFSGLLRTVAPLIKRGAVALGKRALATGAQIAGDVVAGKNVKKAAKRRATAAGRNLMQSLLNTPPPPGKRVKRIKRTAPVAVSLPPNDDSEQTCFRNMAFVHRQSCEGVKSELDIFAVPPTQTSIEDGRWVEHQPLTYLDPGGSNRIRDTGNRRCLPRSCKHVPAHPC